MKKYAHTPINTIKLPKKHVRATAKTGDHVRRGAPYDEALESLIGGGERDAEEADGVREDLRAVDPGYALLGGAGDEAVEVDADYCEISSARFCGVGGHVRFFNYWIM